jgi:SAM-dependent methyltransferase
MTAMPKYDDESYLDFVEGLRLWALLKLNPLAAEALEGALPDQSARDSSDVTIENLQKIADPIPLIGFRNRILSSTQGMNWNRILDSYSTRRTALENELTEAESKGPGTMKWDPDFSYPRYYTVVEYHRQPGGYHHDPLGGYVYHYGTKVFHGGNNDRDEAKEARIWELPLPEDGVVNRFLDLACSIGAGTVAAKNRWPEAEVVGIDAAGPLLRYAHLRATKLNSEVHFKQMLTEDLKFDDNTMDLVYMSTILHEVPVPEGRKSITEAHRVMRNGGVLVIHDMMQAGTPLNAWADYDRHFDSAYNNEPYAYKFVHSDLDSFLTSLFSKVERTLGRLTTWVCTK